MKLGRNLIVGLSDSAWTAILGFIVVPLYLKFLGLEAYGLIGFFVAIQSVLVLLDLGLAQTINREVARCAASGNMREVRNLLHTLAVIYWCVACLIALLFFMLSPYIATYWLNSETLTQESLAHAVMLMGFVIACRWPIGLYKGALIGAQRLAVSSTVNIVMVTVGNVGVVGVLAFVSPSIEAFFVWQAIVGILYAVVIRFVAWRIIGVDDQVKIDLEGLKRIWRFSMGVAAVTISSVILTQIDKVLLSKLLSLEEFGGYALAGVLASGLYVILVPVFNTIFPRMSLLVARGDTKALVEFYRLGTRLLTATLFPVTIAAAYFSKDLIHLWTGDLTLATNISQVVSLLLLGTALNGTMIFPYALQLAYGMTRLPLMISAILAIIFVPLIFFLAKTYGAVGGALAWFSLNVVYLFFGTWLTHRFLLKGISAKWLLLDVLIPLGLSIFIVGSAGNIVQEMPYAHYVKLLLSAGLAMLACITIVMTSSQLRSIVQIQLRNIIR